MACLILALLLYYIPLSLAQKTALCIKDPFEPTLKYPIARTNRFKDLVERSNVFVDKTLMLEEFLAGYTFISVIPSPMGWGKTVLLDMAKMFVEIRPDLNSKTIPKRDETYYDFFKYGLIGWTSKPQQLKTPPLISTRDKLFQKYQGRFPVIYLNLRQLTGRSFLEVFYKFAKIISDAFKEHSYVQDYFAYRMSNENRSKDKQTEAYRRYTIFTYYLENLRPDKPRIREALKYLVESLNLYYLKRVFILIDDYDTPFNCLLHTLAPQDYRKLTLFFKRTYEFTFKCPLVKKCLLTGMFHVDRNRSLMPYNVRAHTYMQQRFADYFGFNRADVDALFELLNLQHLSEPARQWYNGYLSGYNLTLTMYNPSSLIQFINQRQVISYSTARDGFDMLDTMLRIKPFRYTFEMLVNYKTISILADHLFFEPFDFVHFHHLLGAGFNHTLKPGTVASAVAYLASAGYLTLGEGEYHKWAQFRVLIAYIPNQEIAYDFSHKLMARYEVEYEIRSDIIDNIAADLARFVTSNRTKSPSLRASLEDLTIRLDMDLCPRDGATRKQYVTQLVVSMLNFISLKMRYTHRFETELYDEPSKPDIIVYRSDHAAAIVFKYNYLDSANDLLEEAKTYGQIFHHLPQIKSIKFIAISIDSHKRAYVRGELLNLVTIMEA